VGHGNKRTYRNIFFRTWLGKILSVMHCLYNRTEQYGNEITAFSSNRDNVKKKVYQPKNVGLITTTGNS
jgi:hypothetical protein